MTDMKSYLITAQAGVVQSIRAYNSMAEANAELGQHLDRLIAGRAIGVRQWVVSTDNENDVGFSVGDQVTGNVDDFESMGFDSEKKL